MQNPKRLTPNHLDILQATARHQSLNEPYRAYRHERGYALQLLEWGLVNVHPDDRLLLSHRGRRLPITITEWGRAALEKALKDEKQHEG
jgi:hypothetical protein